MFSKSVIKTWICILNLENRIYFLPCTIGWKSKGKKNEQMGETGYVRLLKLGLWSLLALLNSVVFQQTPPEKIIIITDHNGLEVLEAQNQSHKVDFNF